MRREWTGAAMLITAMSGCTAPVHDTQGLPPPPPYAAILTGQSQVMLLAAYRGRFVIDRHCVRMMVGKSVYTPVFYHGTVIGRDAQGAFVKDAENGAIFHDGDRFAGGGALDGPMPDDAMLATGPVPPRCRSPKGTLNPGLDRR